MHTLKQQWFGNVRADILAGIVVGLALIPEALAFAFIVGVDPRVALYASFTIAVIISFVGGRPGLISAATGAMALVLVSLMANHGLQYVLAATILTGIIQFILGLFGVANLMRFIPNSVMLRVCECAWDYDFYHANALFNWGRPHDICLCNHYVNFSVRDSDDFSRIFLHH